MHKTYETLAVETVEPHILRVTLNRPQVANAMNTQMGRDLLDLWLGLVLDPGELRCVILTGAGAKAFCAGGDLKERNGMTDETWQRQHALFEQAVYRMMDCPVPIIAAVNGVAFGGGCELALACDFAYAARSARFALTEVTLGIMPGLMGTQNLPRAVGVRRAKEIILTGTPFTAIDGLAWGMVNKVVPGSELMNEVLAVARKIASNAPVSVRQAKKSMDRASDLGRADGYAYEIEAYNRTVVTEDRQEGINAFNEKRKPVYKGQ